MIPHGVANSHIRPAPKTMGMINYKTRLADSFQQLERFSQILPPGKLYPISISNRKRVAK